MNTITDTLTGTPDHRAGFVNIIGNPNVGKSTLMNYELWQIKRRYKL